MRSKREGKGIGKGRGEEEEGMGGFRKAKIQGKM